MKFDINDVSIMPDVNASSIKQNGPITTIFVVLRHNYTNTHVYEKCEYSRDVALLKAGNALRTIVENLRDLK